MTEPTVFLVDDDDAALDSLKCLLESVGLQAEAYSSSVQFLERYDPARPGCIVLDIRMPQLGGLDVQEAIRARGRPLPVIIVTGHADVPVCTAAFRAGAFDFIEKPANHQLLLGRIQRAIQQDALNRRSEEGGRQLQELQSSLTSREREVMDRLVAGRTLKQIAVELGISLQTASKHRIRVLEKLDVSTDVELVRLSLAGQPEAVACSL
jgi:two-component system response regulator FixJ